MGAAGSSLHGREVDDEETRRRAIEAQSHRIERLSAAQERLSERVAEADNASGLEQAIERLGEAKERAEAHIGDLQARQDQVRERLAAQCAGHGQGRPDAESGDGEDVDESDDDEAE